MTIENDPVAVSGPPRAIDLKLNDLDLDVVPDRVVGADRAIDAAAVVETAIDVLQEIGGRGRRANGVDLHLNRTLFGLKDDDRVSPRPGLLGRGAGQNRNGQQRSNHSDRHRQPSSLLPSAFSLDTRGFICGLASAFP